MGRAGEPELEPELERELELELEREPELEQEREREREPEQERELELELEQERELEQELEQMSPLPRVKCFIVAELLEELSHLPSDAAVVFEDSEEGPTEVLGLRLEREVQLNRGWILKKAVVLRRA